jgi:hypothetical protein
MNKWHPDIVSLRLWSQIVMSTFHDETAFTFLFASHLKKYLF